MEVCGQLHDPAALPSGKEPRYPLDRRLIGPRRWSGRDGEEKIIPSLPLYIANFSYISADVFIIIIIIIIIIIVILSYHRRRCHQYYYYSEFKSRWSLWSVFVNW
jgi:hypothetical protein